MLHGLGIETVPYYALSAFLGKLCYCVCLLQDVDLNQIVEIAAFICGKLDRTVPSSVGKALSISKL
jgi:hypothetical protein